MHTSDKIIHGLWIGSTLHAMEHLTIKSFIKRGHTFVLWTYGEVSNIPNETEIRDANEIIPEDLVFCYTHSNQFGHGKGSYAGFSDLFRYKLLYELGGWWVDMDVTCLKTLHFDGEYVFRYHHKNGLVGNIMKCPPKSDLMLYCYENALEKVTASNTDWMLPLKILKSGISKYHLESYIKDISNYDSWPDVAKMLKQNQNTPDHWYAIHWMNEEWRRLKISKDEFVKGSYIEVLMTGNNIPINTLNRWQALKYQYRIGKVNYSLVNLPFQIKSIFSQIFR